MFVVAVQFAAVLTAGFAFYKALRMFIQITPALLFTAAYLLNPYTLAVIIRLSYPALVLCIITFAVYIFSYLLQRDI